MLCAALVCAAYLVGAIPFGLLIGLTRGVDIRAHGSHNIGATNAGRVLGRGWGILCLVLDILKGLIPTLIASGVLDRGQPPANYLLQWIAVGLAAVVGHTFPIYLRFRGGKGVATTIGVTLGIYPVMTIAISIALLAYAAVRFTTGRVALGSLTLAVVLPGAVLAVTRWRGQPMGDSWPLIALASVLAVLIIVRHRSNISRLLKGEEPRFAAGEGTD